MKGSYIAENANERERLHSLAARLTDEELSLSMENGWTIAGYTLIK